MKKNTTCGFIEKAQKIHGNKYDYSKVDYKNNSTKVCIICPEHGEFWQTPICHLQGHGCPNCANTGVPLTTKKFIEKARKIHGNKYDYSKVEYVNNKTKVCIICHSKNYMGEEHGEFWQTPHDHLSGCGCPCCGNHKKNFDEFVYKAKLKHNNKYTYDHNTYYNMSSKMRILCPIHGEFWQAPKHHLKSGCPFCKESKLEIKCEAILKKYNIDYKKQINKSYFNWLGLLSIDFYLPKYKIAIECQGKQHFVNSSFGSTKNIDFLGLVKERDERKMRLCKENGIKILYYSDLHFDYPYPVIETETELISVLLSS